MAPVLRKLQSVGNSEKNKSMMILQRQSGLGEVRLNPERSQLI